MFEADTPGYSLIATIGGGLASDTEDEVDRNSQGSNPYGGSVGKPPQEPSRTIPSNVHHARFSDQVMRADAPRHALGGRLTMMSRGWSKKNWPALAGRVVPPLVEVAALVWTKHRQHKTSRHVQRQVSEMESLAETLKEKDAQIMRPSSQLASCQEELAGAQQTITRLQKDLEAERRKTWWEKLLRRR